MNCNVNLIQSYTTKIDSESNLGQIVNRACFKDELDQQLFERRLSDRPELLTEQDCFTNQPLGKKHIDYNVQPSELECDDSIDKAILFSKISNSLFGVNLVSGKL